MSDQDPPRKIGSLRDRIAAFENKEPQAPAPAPGPRPKPGHVKWQPRERSPPPAPVHADVTAAEHGEGGMNPSDAAESVGKMSLKERMAALQGRGFGAPAPAAPPIQRTEKKWQPPPKPERTTSASEHEDEGAGAGEERSVRSPIRSPMSALVEIERKEEPGDEPAEDEEEERKRRAAIAARMARLGGARLGMGPPVSAPKPAATLRHEDEDTQKSPEAYVDAEGTKVDLPEVPSQTSLSDTSPAKSPSASMPIPNQPRRAGPPRRRPPKSPGGSTTDLTASGEGSESISATPVNAQERGERKIEPEPEEEEREETEEEAAARRKRIAERIAKQGGLNFLSAPRPVEEEEEGEHPEAQTEQRAEHELEAEAEAEAVQGEVSEAEGKHEIGAEGEDYETGHEHEEEQHDLHEDVQATVSHLQHDSDFDPSYSRSHSGLETESSLEPSGGFTEDSADDADGGTDGDAPPPPLPPKRDAHVPFPKTTDEVEFPSKQSSLGDSGRHVVGSGEDEGAGDGVGDDAEEEDVRGHADEDAGEVQHAFGRDQTQTKKVLQHEKLLHVDGVDEEDEEEEEQWEK